jgi:hypothetical protein
MGELAPLCCCCCEMNFDDECDLMSDGDCGPVVEPGGLDGEGVG